VHLVRSKIKQGSEKTKTKALVQVAVFLVVVLAGIGCYASDKEKYGFYVPKPNEEIYGTWVNKEYSGTLLAHYQKWVFRFWGYAEQYNNIADNVSVFQNTFFLVDKWSDSEGNICYKVYIQEGSYKYGWFAFVKISMGGTVFEYTDAAYPLMWPTEADLNPDNPKYRIYYRQ
jgi:hypothetical protein